MAKKRKGHYAHAYDLKSPDDAVELYEGWAASYDEDLRREYDYAAPAELARVFAGHCADKGAKILDVGCGTGLVAVELDRLGYTKIDGLDISPAMLREAEKKGLYGRLIEADLTKPLDLPDDSYDAMVSAGTFTHGHVGAEGLDELLRVTRPGGPICFTIHEEVYDKYRFDDAFAAIEKAGRGKVEAKDLLDYVRATDTRAWVVTLRVA